MQDEAHGVIAVKIVFAVPFVGRVRQVDELGRLRAEKPEGGLVAGEQGGGQLHLALLLEAVEGFVHDGGAGLLFFVRQQQTLGLGHAVSMAKPFTGDDPFVVIYGDDVIWGEDPVCAQLIRAYEEFGRPAAGVSAVPWADVSRYCSLKTTPIHDNYFFVDDMIEKPKKGQEFSNYSILGRVLLTPEIYDILARTKPGAGGEIQLTDAMAEYARNYGGMTAVEFTGKHYDMGNKLKVAEAQVELALQHPEIGEAFRAYLKEFCKTL